MTTLIAKIKIKNEKEDKIHRLGGLIQNTVNSIDHDDMIKLLEKVKSNPGIVKKALKFI
jgi:hypothetical protein